MHTRTRRKEKSMGLFSAEDSAHKFLTRELRKRRGKSYGSGQLLYYPPIKMLECYDGFRFSLQAGMHHYCSPRSWDPPVWTEWEIGYPSSPEAKLMPYAEHPSTPTDTVYGHVPSLVIMEMIQEHGGLVGADPLEELREKAGSQ